MSDVKFQTRLATYQYNGLSDLDYNEALFGVDSSLRHDLDTFGINANLLRDSSAPASWRQPAPWRPVFRESRPISALIGAVSYRKGACFG